MATSAEAKAEATRRLRRGGDAAAQAEAAMGVAASSVAICARTRL